MYRVTMLLYSIAAITLLTACGGGDGAAADVPTNVDTRAAAESLERLAARAETLLDDRIGDLTSVSSQDELSMELEMTQGDLDDLAGQVEDVETSSNLTGERDQLATSLRDLSSQLGDLQAQVDQGDVQGALRELTGLSAVADVRRAIEDIRAQTSQ